MPVRASIPSLLTLLFLTPYGAAGAFNVTIGSEATKGGAFVSRVWTPTALSSHISIADLIVQLNAGNVTINSNGSGSEPGDITLAAQLPLDDITATVARSLILNAQRNLDLNAAIIQNGPKGDNVRNQVGLFLNFDLASTGGVLTSAVSMDTGGGGVTIMGRNVVFNTSANINTGGGTFNLNVTGAFTANGGVVSTQGGSVTVASVGGISTSGDIVTTGGNVVIAASGTGLSFLGGTTIDTRGGAGMGMVDLRANAADLNLAASSDISSGPTGKVKLYAAVDLVAAGTITAGTGGADLDALDDVVVQAALTSSGVVDILATDDVTIAANVTAFNVAAVTGVMQVAGQDVAITAGTVNTKGKELVLTGTATAGMTGGELLTNGGSLTITAPVLACLGLRANTAGGGATLTGSNASTIGGLLVTSGGNVLVSLKTNGAALTVKGDIIVTGGAGAGRIELRTMSGRVLLFNGADLTYGSGGILFSGCAGVTGG